MLFALHIDTPSIYIFTILLIIKIGMKIFSHEVNIVVFHFSSV